MGRHFGCVLAGAALFLGGCTTATVIPVGEAKYQPVARDHQIDLYLPDDAPVNLIKHAGAFKPTKDVPAGATVIGRMDVDGDPQVGWPEVLKKARTEARKLGGDAILLEQADRPGAGGVGIGNPIYGTTSSISGGSVVRGYTITVQVLRYAAATEPTK